MRELRLDHGTLRKPERTPQGFLRVDGWIGRAGIYEYRNTEADEKKGWGAKGTIRRELRSDEAVFAAAALLGFEGAPITIGHPGKVTADNVRKHEVGTVIGGARRDGDRVAATLIIKDAKAIKAVEGGKKELSPGHFIDYVHKSGVDPKYGRYDGIQTNIVPNHLAIVDVARGGADLQIRLDGEELRGDSDGKLTNAVSGHQHLIDLDPRYGSRMSGTTEWATAEGAECGHSHPWLRNADGSITIGESDGHTHTILDDTHATSARADGQFDRPISITEGGRMDTEEQMRSLKAQLAESTTKLADIEINLTKQTMRADGAEQRIVVLETENTELRTQIASAASVIETEAITREAMRADEAERKVAEFDTRFDNAVKARVALVNRAASVLGGEFRMDGLSEKEIRSAGIKKLDPKVNVGSLNEAQLEARFDALYDLHSRNARSQRNLGEVITKQNEARNDELEAKRQQWRNRGMEPLPNSRTAQKGH